MLSTNAKFTIATTLLALGQYLAYYVAYHAPVYLCAHYMPHMPCPVVHVFWHYVGFAILANATCAALLAGYGAVQVLRGKQV